MRKLKSMLVLFACVAVAGIPASAQAAKAGSKTGMLGGTVKLEYLYTDGVDAPEYTAQQRVLITPEVEYADAKMQFAGTGKPWRFCVTMDVSDTNIRISDVYLLWKGQETHGGRINPTQFNGFILQFNNIRPITSVTINPETNLAATGDGAFNQKAIGFSKNQITINWANVNIDKDTVISLDVNAPAPKVVATTRGGAKEPARANQ
jgi:hypothetical protein